MIEHILRCDKCNCVMEQEWTRILWRSGNQIDLCKKCTADFNKWLKEGKVRKSQNVLD